MQDITTKTPHFYCICFAIDTFVLIILFFSISLPLRLEIRKGFSVMGIFKSALF